MIHRASARAKTLSEAPRARASPIDSSSSSTTTTRRWTIDAASRARAPRTSSRARRSSSSVRRRDVSTALGRALARRRSTVGVMVCTRCEKKMRAAGGAALVTTAPVRRRDLALGARDALDERRPVNENKALSAKRRGPYGAAIGRTKCAVCRTSLHTGGTHCNACAHAKGVCSQCGVKIMDTSAYNGHEDVEDGRSSKIEAASGVKDRRDVSTEDIERAEKREEEEEEEKAEASAEAAKEAAAPTPLAGPTSAADVAREMGQAVNGGQVSGWRFDKASGYYYDVAAQVYYDPKTGGYFCCKTQKWTMPEKKTQAELQKGVKTGSFKDGTRKPDRFGL